MEQAIQERAQTVSDGGRGPHRLGAGQDQGTWSLAAGVYQQSLERAQALALQSSSGTLSYLQLAAQASGLAAQLKSGPGWPRAGEPTPRVGILASRSAEACIAALGASWAGATYVPLGLSLPPDRLKRVMARCRLTALVTDAQGARLLSQELLAHSPASVHVLGPRPADDLAPRVRWQPAQALAAELPQPPEPMGLRETAYIIFTSGSTGEPKGVMLPIGAVRHYVGHMVGFLDLSSSDRVLDMFELGFDVSVHNMLCTWAAGASLHLLPAAQAMNAVGFARQHGITVWNSVPSLVAMLRQVKALGPGVLPSLRLSSFGGEPVTASLVRAWQSAAPHSAIFNLYGPTEATVTCLGLRLQEPLPLLPGRELLPIGRPLQGCEAVLFDAQQQALPVGQTGELAIAGPQLAQGYLEASELTAQRFVWRDGRRWYLSGDLAVQDDSGLFYCLGRVDHQVKVLGHRVELEDVDAHLQQLLDGTLVATLPWPLQAGVAQGLVAFVGAPVDAVCALQALRQRLPPYMVPSRLVALAQMPLNVNGKVDRRALQGLLEAGA